MPVRKLFIFAQQFVHFDSYNWRHRLNIIDFQLINSSHEHANGLYKISFLSLFSLFGQWPFLLSCCFDNRSRTLRHAVVPGKRTAQASCRMLSKWFMFIAADFIRWRSWKSPLILAVLGAYFIRVLSWRGGKYLICVETKAPSRIAARGSLTAGVRMQCLLSDAAVMMLIGFPKQFRTVWSV